MWFGIAAAVGNTIAAGIVRTPGDIARLLPNIWVFFGVWIVGGCYALLGASSLAELGAAIPRSGGQYNLAAPSAIAPNGVIVGWSDGSPNSRARTPPSPSSSPSTAPPSFPALPRTKKFFAASLLTLFILLQWRGVKWGSGTQLVTAVMKTAAFLILVSNT